MAPMPIVETPSESAKSGSSVSKTETIIQEVGELGGQHHPEPGRPQDRRSDAGSAASSCRAGPRGTAAGTKRT